MKVGMMLQGSFWIKRAGIFRIGKMSPADILSTLAVCPAVCGWVCGGCPLARLSLSVEQRLQWQSWWEGMLVRERAFKTEDSPGTETFEDRHVKMDLTLRQRPVAAQHTK
jgi:hypothetical protein